MSESVSQAAKSEFWFVAGTTGPWQISHQATICGEPLAPASRLEFGLGADLEKQTRHDQVWTLRGVTSNTRYTQRAEVNALQAKQQGLGRPQARCAALIPIKKSAPWWALAQDERRGILEDQSKHIALGLRYLPASARHLHHCRDLGEPFDFLTWFEFAPEHAQDFDELLVALRATPEWQFVEREVEVRVLR